MKKPAQHLPKRVSEVLPKLSLAGFFKRPQAEIKSAHI
jgi:hypothetical protein